MTPSGQSISVSLSGFEWALVLEALGHDSRAKALREAIKRQLDAQHADEVSEP